MTLLYIFFVSIKKNDPNKKNCPHFYLKKPQKELRFLLRGVSVGVSDGCVKWVCEYGRGSGFRLAGCVRVFFIFPPPLTLSVTVAFGPNYHN